MQHHVREMYDGRFLSMNTSVLYITCIRRFKSLQHFYFHLLIHEQPTVIGEWDGN